MVGRELDVEPSAPAALRLARATVQSIAGDRLPASWTDEEAVLLGTGRLRLDAEQTRQAGQLARRLPALG